MYHLQLIEHVLHMAAAMLQEMFWPIVAGLLLSALVQSLVSQRKIADALGKNTSDAALLSAVMGAASSSCSYAAAALARSFFQKGATLANAIIFEFGSTNLVIDLSVVIFALLGWQFVAAQYFGGAIMIVILAVLFKFTLAPTLEQNARRQAELRLAGKMEGHAAMDMSLAPGPLLARIFSPQAYTAVSHYFYMDMLSILPDLLVGIFTASILGVLVPDWLWQNLFFCCNPAAAFFMDPLIGPLISAASFVCSIGNIPLAVVLWRHGISFGGVISFIFADLLIIPILNIHRKYYGTKAAVYLFAVSFFAIALAGLLTEVLFSTAGIIPARQLTESAQALQVRTAYTMILNFAALTVMILLGLRFLFTDGLKMLKHMEAPQQGSGCGHCVD